MIKIQSLRKTYLLGQAQITALDSVNAQFEKAQVSVLLGASGSGKSTLLHLAGLIDEPDGGEISFESQALTKLADAEKTRFRQLTFGFIFQSYHLIPTLSCMENVALPKVLKGDNAAACRKRAADCLELVGLKDYLSRNVRALSGGQRQRVAIARALVNEPSVIFADEPTANLDEKNGDAVIAMLRRLASEQKIAVILATHNLQNTAIADRIFTLKDGNIISESTQRHS